MIVEVSVTNLLQIQWKVVKFVDQTSSRCFDLHIVLSLIYFAYKFNMDQLNIVLIFKVSDGWISVKFCWLDCQILQSSIMHIWEFFQYSILFSFFSLESIKHDLGTCSFFFFLCVVNAEDTLNIFYQYSLQHLFFTVLFLLTFSHSTLFFSFYQVPRMSKNKYKSQSQVLFLIFLKYFKSFFVISLGIFFGIFFFF